MALSTALLIAFSAIRVADEIRVAPNLLGEPLGGAICSNRRECHKASEQAPGNRAPFGVYGNHQQPFISTVLFASRVCFGHSRGWLCATAFTAANLSTQLSRFFQVEVGR